MRVQVMIEVCQGIIDSVTVFQFKEDAEKYYQDKGGPALEDNLDATPKHEIRWFEDILVRSMPIVKH